MEAQCAKCGVGVVITEVRLNGYSFQMKSGESLDLLCPVIIERQEVKRDAGLPEECPNLIRAITDRIERLRREQSAPGRSFS
jgi:hypothetical protein